MISRGRSRTAATSKVELFVLIVNSFQPLFIITKSSTLDVAAVLDPPLISIFLYDICFKSYANKHCNVLRILFLYAGAGFSRVSPTSSFLLFCSSCGLLFRIMHDGTRNNLLKYEKVVILLNFSSTFFEPQVNYFNSKNSKTLQVYH